MDNELLKFQPSKGTVEMPVEDRLHSFMREFHANTMSSIITRERIWQNAVGLELVPFMGNKSIHISSIRTFPDDKDQAGTRRKGYASKALDWLCKLADKHQVALDCVPKQFGSNKPEDKGTRLNKRQLVAWYAKRGFVQGRQGMRREPNVS
jgi:hypothetical protein